LGASSVEKKAVQLLLLNMHPLYYLYVTRAALDVLARSPQENLRNPENRENLLRYFDVSNRPQDARIRFCTKFRGIQNS